MTSRRGAESHEPLLSVQGLTVGYGQIDAVHGVSLDVFPGQVVALIGANGAGKTSTLNGLMGLLPRCSGRIVFEGEAVEHLSVEKRVARGISLVQEGRQIVPQLTVAENLAMGAYLRRDVAQVNVDEDWVYHLFPRLKERREQHAGLLSGGEQQMLAMSRALMARPKLLLLDEPSMGLAPLIITHIFEIIGQLNKAGTTILLVEQNARQALALAHHAYVLEQGRIRLSGLATKVASDPVVLDAYLGGAGHATRRAKVAKSETPQTFHL